MENRLTHYSPLRYPGGKNCIFPFMSKYLYENNLIGISYAEPYAGGAGLALRLLFEEYVNNIYINDLDPSIYAFWKSILLRPIDFCEWIEKVDIDIDNWHKYKIIQNNYLTADSFELAKSTFFLNRTNISGVIKGGPIGGIHQKGKYKLNARFNKQQLIQKILKIASFSDRISVSNHDGLEFLRRLKRLRKDVLIYLDPPYVVKGSDLYMNFLKKSDHIELRNTIRKMNKPWIISYDNNDFILDLYSQYRKVVYKLSQCASNRVGDEVLIFDNRSDFENSINQLKQPSIIE
jgi:DNA adenine methylase